MLDFSDHDFGPRDDGCAKINHNLKFNLVR